MITQRYKNLRRKAQSDEFCSAIVSKELDDKGYSKILGQACSPVSPEDAHLLAKRQVPAAAFGAQMADTLLLNQYKHANYDTVLYSYWGVEGPCDSSGYHLINYQHVAENVSSMRGYNNCNKVDAEPITLWKDGETLTMDSSYIGDNLNDDVYELQVRNG